MSKTDPNSFKAEFDKRVASIKERAARIGMSISDVCRASGVSRGTPERWKTQTPLTVTLIDAMESAVTKAEAERAKAE